MCGIAGFIQPSGRFDGVEALEVARRMADRLITRGPDDIGTWHDPSAGIALGHRRLSIVDLSSAGHQPMLSASGRYCLAYNGEVYNYQQLRKELTGQGVRFRGDSDTEVILAAIDNWGLESTLPRLIGMFAIALWDRSAEELILIRDRLGIKPLFWSLIDKTLVFASELKALREFPGWAPGIDRNAIASYMRHNYVPAPMTGLRGVHKLEPGALLRFKQGIEPEISRYWTLREVVQHGIENPYLEDLTTAVSDLDTLLRDAVKRRMIADVPLGALLSGGIDSSLVAALMQAQSSQKIKTYAIGFEERQYNEAPYAKAVADHIGTEHTELYVRPDDALQVIPQLADFYDEPFADSSQIPTYLVCKLTRQHVTVVLSGDGGDELFGGYTRYQMAQKIWDRAQKFPHQLRKILGNALQAVPERYFDHLAMLAPASRRPTLFGLKVHKAARGLAAEHPDDLYRQMLSHWSDPEALVIGATEPKGEVWNDGYRQLLPDFTDRMQFLDSITYLPDDILTKVDRASMAVSLEARVPLLDHRVAEFAWTLPQEFKLSQGRGKIILRELLNRYVPSQLIDRPKMGFGVPIDAWLRGPLRDWAEALLDADRIRQQGLLNVDLVQKVWAAHLRGENWAYHLWDILMLEAWIERYQVST